jgi:peptidoglycan hydrolase-like protein with peptidoglycan-binding domain
LAGYGGPVSGVFNAPLTASVVRFQKRHGLRPDGVVRRSTYEALGLYPPRRVDPPWLEKASRPDAAGRRQASRSGCSRARAAALARPAGL